MFEILRKSLATGIVTEKQPPGHSSADLFARGFPEIDFANWKDARPAASACPTGALSYAEQVAQRTVLLDLGKCTCCGLCAEADSSIQMSHSCQLAVSSHQALMTRATYRLDETGLQQAVLETEKTVSAPEPIENLDRIGTELKSRIHQRLRRSLHIREVDAGSCNGCEVEIVGLNSPVYDIERFGIHFVASPRHADMLLVTGPVSRNMELALKKTYDAIPGPRLVVAVGACGCSGGIFGRNYATLGGVDKVVPVDIYIPGCPPSPRALLKGILAAVGRLK
jgi:Ni,Fe-hydrogenase III small subunit/ferredoxin